MKKSITLGKKILLKDITSLNEVVKTYKVKPSETLNIEEYYIETNIPQYENISISILINGMSGIEINSNKNDSIPIILNKNMKFLFSAESNDLVSIELKQEKLVDVNTVSLITDSTVEDLYIKIYFFGVIND